MRKGIKKKDHENLSDANIEKVIALLEAGGKKTEACTQLNISYNVTRLARIIEDYQDRIATQKKLRAANRGKPATENEIKRVIEDYLTGDSLKDIADSLFRPVDFVKRIIESVGVPTPVEGDALPEQCLTESFEIGEFVWSSKYGALAEIIRDRGPCMNKVSTVYSVYILQEIDEEKSLIDGKRYSHHISKGGGFYANQPAYELGSLRHLDKYGVNVKAAIK